MGLFFRVLLTFNATSWMLVVYCIKLGTTIYPIPQKFFGLILLFIPIILSFVSLWIASFLKPDSISGCEELALADNDFLSTYLGYFFVSLSVSNNITMMYLYAIVFMFTYLSHTQYFNPIFILLGYHHYYILTNQGTRVFLIIKGKVIRNKNDIVFDNLKRINDTTFIQIKEKE